MEHLLLGEHAEWQILIGHARNRSSAACRPPSAGVFLGSNAPQAAYVRHHGFDWSPASESAIVIS
jgi:hypothetical protein